MVSALFAVQSPAASAVSREESIGEKLREFQADPASFMQKIPEKQGLTGPAHAIPRISGDVSMYDLTNEQIDRLEGAKAVAFPGFASPIAGDSLMVPVPAEDRAEDLVDELRHRGLDAMDKAGLLSAELAQQPWSDSYWPIANGVLAWRYQDPAFPAGMDWKKVSDYVAASRNSCSVDQLSPAEKYDLLVGDAKETLTRAMLNEGKGYYMNSGTVETWMGICHGWAPASYMVARPANAVEVVAADGKTKIRFLPSDIKSLVSLLWANARFENRFIGLRCYDKDPAKDENGRIIDPACYGENPGTWHLSVVNQIGVSRRSFVMNATHDTEVWNQPVHAYRYSYFNPQTNEPVATLEQAIVPISEFKADKFKKYRSPKARFVAGIAMDLTYTAENLPTPEPRNGPEDDSMITVQYLYDLELDSSKRIVGGEWYSNSHPGFLWGPTREARALSTGDYALEQSDPNGAWDGKGPVPAEWADEIRFSARRSEPVARIVDALGVLSHLQ